MKIIYVADDGTQFENQTDCEDYEWKWNHPHLKDVFVFDKDGNRFGDIFAEDTYNYSAKVIVSSNEAIQDLHDLANYTGYCCYKDIDAVGEWVFDERKEGFVKV